MTLDTGAAAETQSADTTVAPASAAEALTEKPWYGELTEADDEQKSFKQWVEKKGFKDPQAALKGYRELEKHVGANRVLLPGEGSDIAQWEGWDKLGVPKEAKDYAIERPQLPEGMAWDEGFEGQIKDAAAKLRIHPTQLKGLIDVYTQAQVAQHNGLKEHQAKEAGELQTLFKDWGAEKDQNLDLAKRAGKFFGLQPNELQALEGLVGGRDLMKGLYKLGKNMREGAAIDGDTPASVGVEALKADLSALNERIGKGEALSPELMKKRSGLYKQIVAAGGRP